MIKYKKKKKRIVPATIRPTITKEEGERLKEQREQEVSAPNFDNQPSSCVASMSEVRNPSPAQTEVDIEDVKNSKMVNTIMNIFQSPNPPRVKSKL